MDQASYTKKQQAVAKNSGRSVELTTFYAGEALCGMDILKIQEINKLFEITPVPQAPDYVRGILNLRGQIVTVIDLCKKLGLPEAKMNHEKSRNLVVNSGSEYVGLMVERIGDVVHAQLDEVHPPPENIGDIQGKYFEGVYKTENRLIGILNTEEVLWIKD